MSADGQITLRLGTDEVDTSFLQRMIDRMFMACHQYGPFRENYDGQYEAAFLADLRETLRSFNKRWRNHPSTSARGNALSFILRRLEAYVSGFSGTRERAGNTEYLVNAANGCMIEFVKPQVPGAYFDNGERKGPGFAGLSISEEKRFKEDHP